ncbi:hypothetical protein MKW94_023391 [Papaver nudicaule]|uniref:Uncharacterized protein n=1 Tax=Papaver nudicaule TaxID=74823 RepID=A0AA41RKF8_PAPNU|nr:hypothetical protein [Papaver nudicaule]
MSAPFSRLANFKPISRLFRQVEQEMETVIGVLQPGYLGITEHKFSTEEVRRAQSAVEKAVENWKRNAYMEKCILIYEK